MAALHPCGGKAESGEEELEVQEATGSKCSASAAKRGQGRGSKGIRDFQEHVPAVMAFPEWECDGILPRMGMQRSPAHGNERWQKEQGKGGTHTHTHKGLCQQHRWDQSPAPLS